MRHLSSDELLDIVEGTASAAAAEQANVHTAACGRCAGELTRLRVALAMVREPSSADVPDPSPLFWDHLSARVREAVAAEPAPRASWFDVSWGWRTWIPVAAVVALAVAVALRLAPGSEQPLRVAATTPVAVDTSVQAVETGSTSDDPALALLADLAGDFDWDDVADAGLMAGSGAIDRAMSELTEDERVELHRLVNEELKQWKTPGA